MDPAGGLAEALAEWRRLALQQVDLASRRRNPWHGEPAACRRGIGDTPLTQPGVEVERGRALVGDQVFRDVEADAARTDDRNTAPAVATVHQDVCVRQDAARRTMPGRARDVGIAWRDAAGENDLVIAACEQHCRVDASAQAQPHAGRFDAAPEIAQRLVEFLLARDALGHVELATDFRRGLEQVDRVPALGQHRGAREPSRARADDCDALRCRRALVIQFGLVTGARVDEARDALALENLVKAGLVAGDAGIDLIGAPGGGLDHEIRIGKQRPGHRDHVGRAFGDDPFGHLRRVDAVRRAERNTDLAFHLARDPRKRCTRHRRGDRRNACLVPADAGVQDRDARAFECLGQLHDFAPVAAIRHQVEHREPIDDDEIGADRCARARDDLYRQPHAVRVAAAPVVRAAVGMCGDELVDEVAFRTHDLDAVVTRLASQRGATHESADLALDATGAQRPGRERR